jgi:RNA polymerase sigma-70 factor (ECF subfamily)
VVDSSSLDRLVLAHLPAALRFATRLVGDPDTAEDLVQEALVRVVRSWSGFRGEAAFRTWLFRIVINVFRDSLRRSSRADESLPGADDVVDARLDDPAQAAATAELGQRVAHEVSRLPPRQREVLVLSAYEGLSTAEIAAVLEISEANVHSTLFAARARLKTRLADCFESAAKKKCEE